MLIKKAFVLSVHFNSKIFSSFSTWPNDEHTTRNTSWRNIVANWWYETSDKRGRDFFIPNERKKRRCATHAVAFLYLSCVESIVWKMRDEEIISVLGMSSRRENNNVLSLGNLIFETNAMSYCETRDWKSNFRGNSRFEFFSLLLNYGKAE